MKNINQFSAEINVPVEDIKLILSETNPNWDSLKEITDEEAELIRRSVHAKQTGSVNLIAGMPVNEQRLIVRTAAEILNSKIMLALDSEISAHQALAQVRNLAIQEVYKQSDVELANMFEERAKATAENTYAVLEEVQAKLSKVDALDLKVNDTEKRIDDFLSKFKAGLTQ